MAKKVGDYIMDLGRAVAFYPGLKKITNSTNAVILLCQLIYWSDKTNDEGWIWKSSDQIEEETSLTYNEQVTARKVLVDLGLIEEEYKRLEHQIKFKVNQEELNKQWEKASFKKSKTANPTSKEELPEEKPEKKEEGILSTSIAKGTEIPIINPVTGTEVGKRITDVAPKGDLLDAMLYFNKNSPGAKKQAELLRIREQIEIRFRVNTDDQKWAKFIEFAYNRGTKHNEPIDKFIDWAMNNGFNAVYWTPGRCKELYPQAFTADALFERPFVIETPDTPEEEYEPMPDFAKRNRENF